MYKKWMIRVKQILRQFLIIAGILTCFFLVLSFTDIPYYAYHQLGETQEELTNTPDLIVVMGGGGMPSPDGLMRTFYAAEVAKKYEQAKIIIALPYSEGDSLYQLRLMANELIVKGIDSLRISFEPLGFSTRSISGQIKHNF
jgi:uncharacterized SAM-binding protein YcdF (DUF218 family)